MSMYGADAAGLQQAAAQLRLAADELDAARGNLGGLLGALNWIGNVASSFVGLWNSDYKPRLGSTAGFIRDAAAKLEHQAQQQLDASNASTAASWGSGLSWASPFGLGPGSNLYPGLDVAHGGPGPLENFGNVGLLWGAGSTLAQFEDLRAWRTIDPDVLKSMARTWDLVPDATALNRIGAGFTVASGAIHGFQLGDALGRGDVDDSVRAGIDIVWDAASLNPYVGAGKAAWDVGFSIGTRLGESQVMQDWTGGVVDQAVARGATDIGHRYDGIPGFGNFVGDNVRSFASGAADTIKGLFS